MKKFLICSLLALSFSSISSAAILQAFCGSANSLNGSATGGGASGNGGFGTGTIICPSFNLGAGSTISSVLIDVRFSYDGNDTGVSTNAQVNIAPVLGPGVTLFVPNTAVLAMASNVPAANANYNVVNAPTRGGNPSGGLLSGLVGINGAGATTSFTNNITFTLSSIAQGSGNDFRGGSSVALFATFVYEPFVPPSNGGEIPEPSTVALIGAGLVGVAAVARRRR